ncbi:hypothetical protein [Imhoffiella purpurea]|uniref:Uncharacterized protein n=1 Tax=Imhoffiella purpurea TaxID=1249627 RepID=W9VU94_9GAMM|nr:hypothetical protein [Imhoffiella purpurea]EXJ13930.1 hypothetical protein D779_3130 [Imhoffiella purpurea]
MKRQRFEIRFDSWYEILSRLLLLPPSASYVEVTEDRVEVRMGWAFGSRFPRTAIARVNPLRTRTLSRGVHGLAGRWLVNGSDRGILSLGLQPAQRGHVMGVPVRLRELMVSVEDPDGLTAALTSR